MSKENKEVAAKEVIIKNVVVKIGEREIVLTIEEAKKLKDALEGIFGKEIIKETKIIHEKEWDWYREPYVWPYKSPKITWVGDEKWPDRPYYEVTCNAGMYNDVGISKEVPKSNTMFLSIKG